MICRSNLGRNVCITQRKNIVILVSNFRSRNYIYFVCFMPVSEMRIVFSGVLLNGFFTKTKENEEGTGESQELKRVRIPV